VPKANAIYNSSLAGSGIIHTTTDLDVFQFTTGGGEVSITVKAAELGANLIPRAELWNSTNLVATGSFNGPTTSIIEPKTSVITATLGAGTYFLHVRGGGDYGDMGQYSITVSSKALVNGGDGTIKQPVAGTPDAPVTRGLAAGESSGTPTSTSSDGSATKTESTVKQVMSTSPAMSTSKKSNLVPSTSLADELSPDAVDAVFAGFDREL
jgi:hypothetical protein